MKRLNKIIQHISNNQWLKDFYETLQWISYNDCEDKELDEYFTAFL